MLQCSKQKKGYRIKFDKKQSLFGNEKNKNWVLVPCASWGENTMYRNYLAYNLASSVFDGIEYTTNANWIDVYVNNEYQGVYLLCEHVRVSKGRVDISSEYGLEDTGYLIEYDAYATGEENVNYFKIQGVKYPFTVHSPDPEEYVESGFSKDQYKSQVSFIKEYVSQVYDSALSGDFEKFSQLADVDSFLDMYLLHELFENTDTGWSSFYMYKKPGGKLFAGPAWDFDASVGSSRGWSSPEGIYVANLVNILSPDTASELYRELYKNDQFKNLIALRWNEISGSVAKFINKEMNDEVYQNNKLAMARNYALWQHKNINRAEKDWLNETKKLKEWLLTRIDWLNVEWAIA